MELCVPNKGSQRYVGKKSTFSFDCSLDARVFLNRNNPWIVMINNKYESFIEKGVGQPVKTIKDYCYKELDLKQWFAHLTTPAWLRIIHHKLSEVLS